MKFISPTTSLAAVVVLSTVLVGCNREDVKVQRVPKDEAPAAQAAAPGMQSQAGPLAPGATMPSDSTHAGMSMGSAAPRPNVKWSAPAGWEEKPGDEYRVVSFIIPNKEGPEANVSVIPLPSTGSEINLVNLWRQQMGLPALTEVSPKDVEAVSIGSDQGRLFDIASEKAILGGKAKARMTIAMLERGGTSWFFKLTGEDAFVHSQKPAFLDFLKSISFEKNASTTLSELASAPVADPHAGMTTASSSSTASASNGSLPAGWKEVPATQFLVAKYIIDSNGAQAAVNVSMLSGTGGGLLPNVNRWRGQLGLPAITEGELTTQTQSLDVAGSKATLVDIAGASGRLIGIVVPQGDQTWFYKLMGDAQIVEQQKDAFTKFVQNAKFSNAP